MADTPPQTPTGGNPEADRQAKLERFRDEFGIDPYGRRVDGLIPLAEALDLYDESADSAAKETPENDTRPTVKVAGRIVLHRDIGSLVFATLRDASGDLQFAVSKKAVPKPLMKLAKLADLGDIVVVEGKLAKTKTGEVTVWAEGDAGFQLACKSLAPPPEKWAGLKDPELRYRKRYVDMYANPDVTATMLQRSRILKATRDFFCDRGFVEVETPMMQPIAGGAAARPFVTHINALDIDLYLRIAPELYLKRLLVGGMPKVFEINRNFRNEGVDRSHNPEFTMLELYEAFGDLYRVMDHTEQLFQHLVRIIKTPLAPGSTGGNPPGNPPVEPGANGETDLTLPYGELTIDYANFRRAKYLDLFEEHNGFAAADRQRVLAKARELHVDNAEAKDPDLLLNEVWEQTVEPHLVQPTFVIDYPASLCPLTKRKPDDPGVAERFELFIANMELANAYTELNDPAVQRANFEQQLAGEDDEESTFRTMDRDFVEALRVGMPPAGGLGIGIDRLVMLLTNKSTIRDVILFPLMKPTS